MSTPHGKFRLLLADDEEGIRFAFQTALDMAGYEVVVAESGPEVLEKLSSESGTFDLVIADLQMPGMSGTALIDALLSADDAIPVLIISGFQASIAADELLNRGCKGYLEKPFEVSQLIEAVQNILGKARSA